MTDLRDQLRQAETVEQRCDAMDGTISALLPDGPKDSDAYNRRGALYQIVDRVRRGDLPVAMLTGVVLALVPKGSGFIVASGLSAISTSANATVGILTKGFHARVELSNPECALALALLAMEEGNG